MLIINLVGCGLITLIIWWFWLYKPTPIELDSDSVHNEVTVIVDAGIYQPSYLVSPEHKPVNLNFIRKDPSSCAATLLFPDLGISANLPLNKRVHIKLPILAKGEYIFHCQMKMYSGTLVIK